MKNYLFEIIEGRKCCSAKTCSMVIMLTICACVLLAGSVKSYANSESSLTGERIAQLPSFVPMEKYSNGSDVEKIKTAIDNCIKKYSIGKEKNNWTFWACISGAFGRNYWDRNYKVIICMVYNRAARNQGTDVDEICKNCHPDPCTDIKCGKELNKYDCCDIEKIKCFTDAIMDDPSHLITAAVSCDNEWTSCYIKAGGGQ